MIEFLPLTFLVLTAVVMVSAMLFLWQSFRAMTGALDPAAILTRSTSVEQQALEAEKDALLDSLRDLKFEWQVGKLSDGDYEQQEAVLRKRTREVMRHIDQAVEPFRESADKLIAKSKGGADG